MATRHRVQGYDAFNKLITELSEKKFRIFVLFSGSGDSTSGNSWCPDCVKAEPVIEHAVAEKLDSAVHFVHVEIERDMWKEPSNVFRTDPRLKLTCVPTLMLWGSVQRLGDSQCARPELVDMLLQAD